MDARGLCSALVFGLVLWPMTASLGTAQSVAVREESAAGKRQVLITVSATRAPIVDVLRQIAAQADLALAFPDGLRQDAARVTVDVRDMPLDQVLARVLDGTGFKATVRSGGIGFSADASGTVAPVAQGGVSGKVIDAKTRQGLRGATISISGTGKGTTTSDDGSFRFSGVVPGSYTIQVRMLGYVKTSKPVTVTEGQTTSLEISLEPSVNALDQVVVTGTIIPTAQKAVPNAMTVITAKEIEQRGITHIDQLFRGDIPGLFVLNLGSASALDSVVMFSRGATLLPNTGVAASNSIKTYVDGVELANPSYLSQLDPTSIERIEILTGPQASTIYGSNAINGVMQIFTKRGSAGIRTQLTATLLSGLVQNNFRSALTPQHDDAVQINGAEGAWSYNAGGSWNYIGPWTPAKRTSRTSGFGGARTQWHTSVGSITADASLRLALTRNQSEGSASQEQIALREAGTHVPSVFGILTWPMIATLHGQTLGLTVGYAPTGWWSHELVVGTDLSNTETDYTTPRYAFEGDTLVSLMQAQGSRTSLRYATTVQIPVSSWARTVITLGADSWHAMTSSTQVSTRALTGTLTGTPQITRQPAHNTGAFVQGQFGVQDALFVTYGLRAEWNPNYGVDAQPNLAPRYGIAYTRDVNTPIGAFTTKLRASYGRSTRPPETGKTEALSLMDAYGSSGPAAIALYGPIDWNLANPHLSPETQQGVEGGLELYFGTRGALIVTRYNQTVDNLIQNIRADSARTLLPNPPSGWYDSDLDADGYGYLWQYQYLNVASVRNQGWELRGSLNMGPFTTSGTYSWTKSRVLGITPAFRSALTTDYVRELYRPGKTYQFLPEHTWAIGTTYTQNATTVSVNVTGHGTMLSGSDDLYNLTGSTQVRLAMNRLRMSDPRSDFPIRGSLMADVNATHRFAPWVEGVLQIQNVTDVYQNEISADYATLGRQSKIGLRIRF